MSYAPTVSFAASPTLSRAFVDDSFVVGVEGPLGSGKTTWAITKLLRHAMEQAPDGDNIKRTRWAVIRNTYPDLKSTSIKSWLELVPEEYAGRMVYSAPITHHVVVRPQGGSPGFDMEVLFLSLDKPADVRKLKSLEVTGAWVNEANEIPVEIIDMLTGRVGRFPSVGGFDGKDELRSSATWAGIIMDTNAPDDQNWWHRYSSGNTPVRQVEIGGRIIDISWSFYRQPMAVIEVQQTGKGFEVIEPGVAPFEVRASQVMHAAGRYWAVNPGAENLKNLRAGYYHQQMFNKTLEWIQRYAQAKRIYMADGKPWMPEYSDTMMVRSLPVDANLPLVGGLDIGGGTLQPAATIGQRGPLGDVRVLRELSMFDIGLDRFSEELRAFIMREFRLTVDRIEFWSDPAGETRDEIYETTGIQHLRSKGFKVRPAPSNAIKTRREALALPMGRLINTGSGHVVPGFMVDPSCVMLRAGLAGKWATRRIQVAGTERYAPEPEKNKWSHVCDACGYMAMGMGEYRALERGGTPGQQTRPVQPWDRQRTIVKPADWSPFT